ncbi:hypothetical protein SY2F82_14040 [Streptomyces sp. Y2F8-2]|nr:hypothetical protein SY2F82_14040 [Streptomyces sp. Y2F8-2]
MDARRHVLPLGIQRLFPTDRPTPAALGRRPALAGALAELLGRLFGSPLHDLRTTVHQNEGSKPFVRWLMEGDQ